MTQSPHRYEDAACASVHCVISERRDVRHFLVNPNNPTGQRFARGDLLDWQARLRARDGWLLIDEAFIDTCPELSLAAVSDRDGLILLRSLGKFFGLAGARVGFVP